MPKDDPDKPSKFVGTDKDEDVLAEAQERFEYAEDQDGHNRRAQLADTRFVYEEDGQWDTPTIKKRRKWKLPYLQFNQLKQFVHQVVNDQRQGRPGIRFHPASGDASEKVAELKQDLARGIEYASDAEAAYDTGFLHTVVGGRGYWRILTDYESPKSFNRCIKVGRLQDPQQVRIDPDWQKADASDIKWGFVLSPMKKSEYERKYKSAPLSWTPGEANQSWYLDKETVIVADYYSLETKERELVLIADGSVLWRDELEDWQKQQQAMNGVPFDLKEIDSRPGEDVVCRWYTLGGGEKIIKRNPWKGHYIPLITCLGDEIMIDGKRHIQGLIRHAKGPQVLLNAGLTEQVVTYSLTSKAPYLSPIAAIKGHEHLYENANNENYSNLPYNDWDETNNRSIAAPKRQQASMPDAGWINWTSQMIQQIRSTLGMYQNSIGQQGNEISGKAILAREKQGDNATFHYLDNLSRAIKHTGVVIDDLIPSHYDTKRLVSLIGVDGKQRLAPVNESQMQIDPNTGVIQSITNPDNDVTRGEYAVTVEAGPSYATKREETRATLVEVMNAADDAIKSILMGKLMRIMDMPDADEIADDMDLMLPPAIQQARAARKAGQNPELAQMQQQMQQLQQQAQEAVQTLQGELTRVSQECDALKADKSNDAAATAQKAQQSAEKHDIDQAKIIVEVLKVVMPLIAPQPVQGAVAEGSAAGAQVLGVAEAT